MSAPRYHLLPRCSEEFLPTSRARPLSRVVGADCGTEAPSEIRGTSNTLPFVITATPFSTLRNGSDRGDHQRDEEDATDVGLE